MKITGTKTVVQELKQYFNNIENGLGCYSLVNDFIELDHTIESIFKLDDIIDEHKYTHINKGYSIHKRKFFENHISNMYGYYILKTLDNITGGFGEIVYDKDNKDGLLESEFIGYKINNNTLYPFRFITDKLLSEEIEKSYIPIFYNDFLSLFNKVLEVN